MARGGMTITACGLTFALAACGGSTDATATARAKPAAATSSPAHAAGVGRCHTAQLRLFVGRVQGAAGSRLVPLVLRNHSGRTCTLRGFPGVSLLDRHGRQIGGAAGRDHARPVRTIRVRPGRAASAMLSVAEVTGACAHMRTSRYVRVFPPNAFHSLRAPLRVPACRPFVTPVVSGTDPTG